MVKIGQRVRFVPVHHNRQYADDGAFVCGVITYINRRHGWYLAEMLTPFGERIREAFRMGRKAG